MTVCDQCGKEIVGDTYITNKKKNDGRKFCGSACFNEYYAPSCFQCGKKCPNFIVNTGVNDSKKFCCADCCNSYYNSSSVGGKGKNSGDSEFRNWIVLGVIAIIILIIVWKILETKKDSQTPTPPLK